MYVCIYAQNVTRNVRNKKKQLLVEIDSSPSLYMKAREEEEEKGSRNFFLVRYIVQENP